jgi:hypothetical protein
MVHLTADGTAATSAIQRAKALEAVIRFGIKSLPNPARIPIQRPAVVFESDRLLAAAFDNQQRQALAKAVNWAHECRFE